MTAAMLTAALTAGLALLACTPAAALAQGIDLSHGGAVTVTARDGIDLDQTAHTVTARGQARAVRGDVTVDADELIAYYRKKAGASATPVAAVTQDAKPGSPDDTGSNEIYRLEAIGHVHIYTPTDNAVGDRAIYDIDQAVMVLTGDNMKVVTPQDTLTARDSIEYWSQLHRSVGRGDATVTTNDGRRVRADVLVGYTTPDNTPQQPGQPPAKRAAKPAAGASTDPTQTAGKLQRVEAYGHVVIQTQSEIVHADRGVYVPDIGIARLVGNVHITRGQNQLNGAAAIVNMKTGIATLTEAPGQRVQGLVVPNDAQTGGTQPGGTQTGGTQPGGKTSTRKTP